MRITNKAISDNFLVDMQKNLQNLNKVQQQISTMKNFSKPSDDPLNVEKSMQLQTSINANDQYYTNISTANSWMSTTDTSLTQIGTILTNVRKDLIASGDPGYTQDEMDKLNNEVNQDVSQLAQVLNTNLGGEYIFGGTNGLSKPVVANTYNVTRTLDDGTTDTVSGMVSVDYSDKNGNVVDSLPEVESNGFNASNWAGKTITFDVNGTSTNVTISAGLGDVNSVVNDLKSQIQSNPSLKDKIDVVQTNDGNIKFIASNSADNIKMIANTVPDMTKAFSGTTSAVSNGFNISNWAGKTIAFNVNGTDYTLTVDSSDKTEDDVVSDLNNQIQNKSELSALKGRISVSETDDGNIKFTSANSSDDIEIASSTTVDDMMDSSTSSPVFFGMTGVVSDGFTSGNWAGKTIAFNVNGTDYTLTVDSSDKTEDQVVNDLNDQIKDPTKLSFKLNGKVKFETNGTDIKVMVNNDNIKMTTDVPDISPQLSNATMENINGNKSVEVSQGVVLDFNATAVQVLKYGNGQDDDTRKLMDRIQHHLAGEVMSQTNTDGSAVTKSTEGAVLGSDGNYYVWKYDKTAAKKELLNQDVVDIDAASKQVLKVSSEIGSKSKGMDSLGNQNRASKLDVQDILSKTEDVDITEKTIEYSTMVTVYQACLQTGAKVMQPTLLDYIK